jgi:hypothetical protein
LSPAACYSIPFADVPPACQVLREVFKTGIGDVSKDEGDYWDLAGTFVFSADGEVVYEMRQKTFADTPTISELMNACRRAAGA